MHHPTRIFIIGHPGAGKALLAKSLAERLGWTFMNIDFELEFKIGEFIENILGNQGIQTFQKKYQDIIRKLPEKTVVTTDAGITSFDIVPINGFVIYLKVSTSVQMSRARVSKNQAPLLLDTSLETFFDALHQARDKQYEAMANLVIDSDDNALELHIQKIMDNISIDELIEPALLEQRDMSMMHNT